MYVACKNLCSFNRWESDDQRQSCEYWNFCRSPIDSTKLIRNWAWMLSVWTFNGVAITVYQGTIFIVNIVNYPLQRSLTIWWIIFLLRFVDCSILMYRRFIVLIFYYNFRDMFFVLFSSDDYEIESFVPSSQRHWSLDWRYSRTTRRRQSSRTNVSLSTLRTIHQNSLDR